ncbi:MAG TPA: hypothetical protein VIC04_02505, partial [Terriglobia bacterium]
MRTVAILAVLAVGTTALPAAAQSRHDGFWIGFGIGGGANLDAGVGDKAGGAAYLRLGGTPTPQLLIGGEVNGWGRTEDGATMAQGNATGNIAFYPSLNGGLFLKAGIGFASQTFETQVLGGTLTITDEGLGT